MSHHWAQVAERIVDGLDVRAGELIQLRDLSGRLDVTQEILLAVERRGATPLLQLLPPDYLPRLLTAAGPAILAHWDQHRRTWLEATNRIIVLAGATPDLVSAPSEARDAWREAVERLTREEERRCIPYLLVAVPTTLCSEQLGLSLPALDNLLIPALSAPPSELQQVIDRVLAHFLHAQTLTIRSGVNCTLQLSVAGRHWLSDTGTMPVAGRLPAGTQPVLNLPSGGVYTTVVETATQGRLWFPEAAGAHDVTLDFAAGQVVRIEAAHGASELNTLFEQHTGEPRRISHIGIGLNPYLKQTIGWPLVDENRQGALLVAFGENRYLGGQNASSLNIDFVIPSADFFADQQAIVRDGLLSNTAMYGRIEAAT
jgi:leucyl aminopeptidase (aminopeptidase T)